MDKKIADQAVDQLSKNERRRRDEEKQLVEYFIPIFLGILAAVMASLTVDTIFDAILCFKIYNLLFKLGIILIGISVFVGVFYLFAEKKFFDQNELYRGLHTLDLSEMDGKPNTRYLALIELSNRRTINPGTTQEQRKIFKAALEKHKYDLYSWTLVKNPEKFYTPTSLILARKLFWLSLSTGGIGVFVFIYLFLAIL